MVDGFDMGAGALEARHVATLRALSEAASGVLQSFRWRADGTPCFPFVGARFEELYGFRPEEVREDATPLLQRIHSEDRAALASSAAASRATMTTWRGQFRYATKDRGEIWIETCLSPVAELDGGLTWHGFATDVTARKEGERELLKLKGDLERRVELRTAELQLANRELEAFTYSVSHDLRAPLRTIDGFSLAVLEDHAHVLSDEGRRLLQLVRTGAKQMGVLIDELLSLSRVARAKVELAPVDMNALVRDTMTALARERVGRRVELRLEPLPPCLGDQPLLGHVWQNLLGNALKYTSRRDVAHIEVRGSIDAAAGQATYVVTDDGAGFDMRHAGRLFGPFQRLHRADEFEGTGVGLAIAQRIVHRHGGRIWGEGEPGVGATFSFSLPSTPLGPTGEGA